MDYMQVFRSHLENVGFFDEWKYNIHMLVLSFECLNIFKWLVKFTEL